MSPTMGRTCAVPKFVASPLHELGHLSGASKCVLGIRTGASGSPRPSLCGTRVLGRDVSGSETGLRPLGARAGHAENQDSLGGTPSERCPMTSGETLDREVYVQGQIIKDDEAGVRSLKTSTDDRILLKLQIGIRTALIVTLMKRRGALPLSVGG